MIRHQSIAVLAAAMLTSCSEKWPDDGVAWLEDRLPQANSRFDCNGSDWNDRSNIEAPPVSALDGEGCRIDPDDAEWFASETAVKVIGRCRVDDNIYEFSVIRFSANHDYDGHYCSRAGAPVGSKLPPLGKMTIGGTAMDDRFLPLERSAAPN